MVDPIREIGPTPPPPPSEPSYAIQAKDFKQKIDMFAHDLKKVLENPGLSQDTSYLSELKNHIVLLHESIQKINPR